jgi:hypothetical protein
MRQTRKTQAPTENERRADDAQDAMIRFAWRTDLDINRNADGPETVLVDLLANIGHFCDRDGLNLARILRIASSHYAVETTSADDPQQFAAEAESESGHTFATTDDLVVQADEDAAAEDAAQRASLPALS